MKLKTSEQEHIKALGHNWSRVLAAASLSVRLDPKLVGLDKIRAPLAIRAALKATGCADCEGFVVPKDAGPSVAGFQKICDAAFEAAFIAALEKFQPAF